jgi:D-alanyl-D-alanine carboxypeptidase/D-alanyl-D-alanine-endopeptidase (penicillin-binding protein 4)
MRKFLLLVAALGCLARSAVAVELHGLPPDALALWAGPVEGDGTLAEWRADAPVSPASTMKLLTSWAALDRLGPDFTWRTTLVSDAGVVDGVLQGDLYWVGQGDPRFFADRLQALIDQLRERGIRRIAGRLVLDGSAYRSIPPVDGFESDGGEGFMVPPDPLLTNLNMVWLRYFNDGNGVRVAMEPPLAGVLLDNRLEDGGVGNGACPDVRRYANAVFEGGRIVVRGRLPRSCDGATSYLQTLAPRAFAAAAFSGMWQRSGGEGPVAAADGSAPVGARVLAAVDSDPLSRVLPDMNKFSSNPMARSLYLTMGRLAASGDDTTADAERAVQQTLAAHGLSDRGLVLENGSGLSRRAQLSARLLGQVLREAARGPYGSEFMASLPVAGETGTLKRRFADIGARLRLKTGTLRNVAALAGYWLAPDGRRLVIVAIVNHSDAAASKPALDAVVRDVIRQAQQSGI